jgi:hypothetical protein
VANAVLVVNGFMGRERAPKHLFHDYAVLLAHAGGAAP